MGRRIARRPAAIRGRRGPRMGQFLRPRDTPACAILLEDHQTPLAEGKGNVDPNSLPPEVGIRRHAHLGEAEQRAYLRVRNVLMLHEDRFPQIGTPAETNTILRAVLDDTPDLFWFEGAWRMDVREGRPFVLPAYTCDRQTAYCRQQELSQAVGRLLARARPTDPYHIALGLYDWMLGYVRYGCVEGSSGQTSYDALVRRAALCKGIAKGYQLLLSQFGIPSALVRGSIGGTGRHVWNLVYLGPSPLHVDITLAHSRFDHLFPRDERDNPRRCFLMDREALPHHAVVMEEAGHADAR